MKKTIEVGKRYTIRNSFYATAIYFTKVEGRPLTLDYYVDGLVWDNWMRFQGVYRNWKLLFAPNIAGKAEDWDITGEYLETETPQKICQHPRKTNVSFSMAHPIFVCAICGQDWKGE